VLEFFCEKLRNGFYII